MVDNDIGVGVTRAEGVVCLLVEAEIGHVGVYLLAVVVLQPVTSARVELGSLLLPSQDRNGVEAAVRALLTVEHEPAEFVVVVQSRGTECVSLAYPLGDAARYDRLVSVGDRHLGSANFHTLLRLGAEVIAALTLRTSQSSPSRQTRKLTRRIQ